MNSTLAAIIAAFLSLFGVQQPAVSSPQTAAAAAAVSSYSAAPPTDPAPLGTATTTVVQNYITEPVIEREVQTPDTASPSYVTQGQFNAGLSALGNSLQQLINGNSFSAAASPPLGGGAPNTIAAASAIDQLSGVTISNSTIDSASIPDLSGKYLSLDGGAVTGTTTFATALGIGTNSPASQLDLEGWTVSSGGGSGPDYSSGNPQINVSGTLNANIASPAHTTGFQGIWQTVGASSSITNMNGMRLQLDAGFTGNSIVRVLDAQNYVAGASKFGVEDVSGTLGATIESQGDSTGDNIGVYGIGEDAAGYNIGGYFRSFEPPLYPSQLNVGLIAAARGNGHSVGAFFEVGNNDSGWINGFTEDTALMLDNNNLSNEASLLVGRTNGVDAFTITNTGGVISTSTTNATNFWRVLNSAGSNVLDIDTSNTRLGVGTSTPGSILSLGSLANFTTATSTFYSTGGLNLTGGGCFAINGTCVGGGGGSSQWTTSGSNISYTAGNVGVGTTSPIAPFTLVNNTNAATLGANGGGNFWIEGSANNIGLTLNNTQTGGRNWGIWSTGGSSGVPSAFRIIDNTPGAGDRLDITSTGNVGIGTTTPGSTFSVNGQIATNNLPANPSGNTLCYSSSGYGIIGTCSSDERLKNTITPLATSSDVMLNAVLNLEPVTFKWDGDASTTYAGFIAQDVMQQIPLAVRTDPSGYYSLDTTAILSYVVGAIQNLYVQLTDLANTVAGFADSFTTQELTFNRATGNEITANQVNTQELCIGSTCVTETQLQALLVATNQTAGSAGDTEEGATASTTADTPPIIQINGDNPAIIQVGATYNDLGATITGPIADLNLGIQTFVNGSPMNPIQLDTTEAATDTIDYVATDQSGLTSTSTRTVIIEAPSIVPSDTAGQGSGSATTTIASTTDATSTAQ